MFELHNKKVKTITISFLIKFEIHTWTLDLEKKNNMQIDKGLLA